MARDFTIGIDLGGTNIVALVVASDGSVVARQKEKTGDSESLEQTARSMYEAVDKALQQAETPWDDVEGVGVAVPASIDPATGELLHAPNLGWRNEPCKATIERIFRRDIYLENDVNCGTLGEFTFGAAKGAVTAVGFFMGTGLGGGVIVNGKLHRGLRGAAGEVGHQIIKYGGRQCGCGHNGCAEAYCSKTGFGKAFEKRIIRKGKFSVLTDEVGTNLKNVRSKILASAYLQGDKQVCKVLQKGARLLGVASANVMAVLAPDCLVYGGGVMEALGEELLPFIREGLVDHLFGLSPEDLNLKLSELGDDAVPLGAALLAQAKGDV